jgi:hypothetical protein
MLANKNGYSNSIYKINIKKYKQNLNHRTEIGSKVLFKIILIQQAMHWKSFNIRAVVVSLLT